MKTLNLTINGKEIKFSFGLGFLGELIDDLDIGFDELFIKYDRNPFKYIPLIMFHSAKFTAENNDKEIDFTKNDLCNWIDDDGGLKNESMIKFSHAFIESINKDVPKEEESKGNEPKKK